MTKEDYHRLAPKFDHKQWFIEQEAKKIPLNVNRSGKYYQHLIKEIRRKHEQSIGQNKV